ncbi:uncharacterized protein K02A2.6-like [Diabrotica virgifera virgifera]|uniref:RNA-directed DNA polymerase n=1 Tax=Diabrotica virgifera virgifera TaxID=50390 RepID=A0ABM5K2K1_DIAVI|nr:uncharacterized protein K02A2.6-like [Diabrotica virgifera virgifera]
MAVMGINVKLPPDFDLQDQNAASEWKFWKTSFEDYLLATGQDQSADKMKMSILRNIIGAESAKIMSTFEIPEAENNKYDLMISLIDKYVNPRMNESFERYNFIMRVQKEGESFEQFLTSCRHLIRTCNYNEIDPEQTAEDKALRDKILMNIRDPVTREALLRVDKLTLQKAIEFCRTSEQSKNQNLKFHTERKDVDIGEVRKDRYQGHRNYNNSRSKANTNEKFKCKRCQSTHGARECPAYGKKCKKCGLLNHFAKSCRVKNIDVIDEDSSDGSADSFVGNVNKVYQNVSSQNIWDEIIEIENKRIKVKLDTGADVSIIPLKIFKKIDKQFKIRDNHYVLKGFEGTQAKTMGVVNLFCKHKNKYVYEDFTIINGATRVLLSGKLCIDLGLVKRINNIESCGTLELAERDKFINLNPEVFRGHGKFCGKHRITTVDKFEPVSYPPVNVPVAIRDNLKNELDRLTKRGAIVKVNEIDPRASINRIVIVEKQNGKLRLCLDPLDLNKQIVRKPRVVHKLEDVCAQMIGKKIFSVFDLSEGYHHLELDETSSWKCCFATSYGIFRYKVLPYGLSNSQDLFQEVVEDKFKGIENLLICHDDMIVMGTTKEEHDTTVKKVLERAKEVGAKFNGDKFQYCQEEVRFMGQVFSHKGMQIDPDRVESLCKLEKPNSKVELQRILGAFNYVRRYIPNMAEHIQPLCQLLKNNVEWVWLPSHQKCFDNLKNIICKSPALVPYDPNQKIILQCDASKNGLGVCMFQKYDSILKLVACASRNMNDSEINYSQTEKELLAIYYATQKFHNFIYNFDVDVQSDHKPIISIMKKPISKIGSVRLQRLRLKLLKYRLNVYFVPGKDIHFADMLSRSSLNIETHDPEMFEMVHSVSKHLPMSQEKQSELRLATSQDEALAVIFDFYYNGWPKEKNVPQVCKKYYGIRDSLYFEAGIAFIDDKIIIPKKLRLDMIKLLHKGHIGVSKTINKARSIYYWPGLNDDVTNYIKKCRICEKYRPNNFKEPMMPHDIPRLRFNKVGTDILEYGSKAYLVIVDYFSHWLDISILKDKTSSSVINSFQDTFSRFGYPEILIADNLPFTSVKCKNYYREKDITIMTCTPHYHQSNGLAEKAVNISKQILRKSNEENVDFRDLVMEYNNTCIINLDASPAQILQSRILRGQLPTTANKLEPTIQKQVYKNLCKEKEKLQVRYDKTARRKPVEFRKGDRVVIRSSKDNYWRKAIVLEKANEPRSYWVKKEDNNKIIRRNSHQMKHSYTTTLEKELILEPELYPDIQSQSVHKDTTHINVNDSVNKTISCPSPNVKSVPTLSHKVNPNIETSNSYKTRVGRNIKTPYRYRS